MYFSAVQATTKIVSCLQQQKNNLDNGRPGNIVLLKHDATRNSALTTEFCEVHEVRYCANMQEEDHALIHGNVNILRAKKPEDVQEVIWSVWR